MSVTASSVRTPKVPGDELLTETDITFDNSYPAGGEPVTAEQLQLTHVTGGWASLKSSTELAEAKTPVVAAFFDVASMKVKLIDGSTGKELAAAVNASKVVVRVFATGK